MSTGEGYDMSDKKRGKRTPLEQLARERKHARVFFWLWCGIATALSIVANYLHLYADPITVEGAATTAAHTVELSKVQRGLVGVTAPLMLMMSLHGLWLMLKNTSTRGVPEAEVERPASLWWLGAAGIGVVAVVAFYVSYTGLIVLARSAGMTEWQSNVYPLILDVPILVSLLALLIVRPIKSSAGGASRSSTPRRQPIDTPPPTPERQPIDSPTTPEPVDDRVSATAAPTLPTTPEPVAVSVDDTAVANDIDADSLAFATEVRARAKVKSSPEIVHRVIEVLRETDGNISAAQKAAGVKSRDPVRSIAAALAELDAEEPARALTAVG
ncbi:hypothetical protein EB73_09670 [Mycobacterium sp. SWH-M3]|nr:hypothetical protein EB73_09670 [Mycobacterium sp. SWH-M3]